MRHENEELVTRFAEMQDMNDLLSILNSIVVIVFGEKGNPISLRQLNYFSISKYKHNHFSIHEIPKKSAGMRTIHVPINSLKNILKCVNYLFQTLHKPHQSATGFVRGKSIVDNAKLHINKGYVYNLDLKDFFPSINRERIWGRLLHPPFNLGNSKERIQIANRISFLCSVPILDSNGKATSSFILPQGAPTSPTITNFIAEKLDRKLYTLSKRNHVTYSRYADDITFSSNKDLFTKNGEFLKRVINTIENQNFEINNSKVRKQQNGYRQIVTGLVVNEKVNVTRQYIKRIRQWLYLWETYGYSKASEIFSRDYSKSKVIVEDKDINMSKILYHKIEYLKMVKGIDNSTYIKLKARYENIISSKTLNTTSNLLSVLEKIHNGNIIEALTLYNNQENN